MALTTRDSYKMFARITDTSWDDFLYLVIPMVDAGIRTDLNRPVIEKQTGLVEIVCGRDSDEITLAHNPVQAIAEIREDFNAGFGSATDSFNSDTILDASKYSLKLDDPLNPTWSRAGIVCRINGVWSGRAVRQVDRLASYRAPSQGTIKVTYTAGLTSSTTTPPLDLSWCANETISFMRARAPYGMAMTAEALAEYSYTLSQLMQSFFTTPTAATILAKYRRAPF